ncbi:MAG: hypothetical protein IJ228_06540 [Succinivibrio sp.]|nr:hypothetical protein [Succinivibrio sp.]
MWRSPRTGVLGGSFNPVHRDHMELALLARELCALDEVLFVPNNAPPHRHAPQTAYADRLAMLALAVEPYQSCNFKLSDLESEPKVNHYTYDTLKRLRAQVGPQHGLFFILGLDSLLYLDEWHKGLQLTDYAHLVCIARVGYTLSLPEHKEALRAYIENRALLIGEDTAKMPTEDLSQAVPKKAPADSAQGQPAGIAQSEQRVQPTQSDITTQYAVNSQPNTPNTPDTAVDAASEAESAPGLPLSIRSKERWRGELQEILSAPCGQILVVRRKLHELSSTVLRQTLAQYYISGNDTLLQSLQGLIDPVVLRYILSRRLYAP